MLIATSSGPGTLFDLLSFLNFFVNIKKFNPVQNKTSSSHRAVVDYDVDRLDVEARQRV
jgi:hypothetical protein